MNNYNIDKIGLFKTIGYSITKPGAYIELSKQKKIRIISYFWILLVILAATVGMIYTHALKLHYGALSEKLVNDLPEMKYENEQFTAEEKDLVIDAELYNNVKLIFKTDMEKEDITEEYINSLDNQKGAVIFLKSSVIILDTENNEEEYSYQDFNDKYLKIKKEDGIVNKEDIVARISKISYIAYFFNYFSAFFMLYGFIICVEIMIVAIISWILVKILKKDLRFKQLLKMSVFAFTLPILLLSVYLIISYITKVNLYYFQVLCAVIGLIYMLIAIKRIPTKA